MKSIFAIAALVAVTSGLLGQAPPAVRQELEKKEAAAARDPDALVLVAEWARKQGLADESKRILEAVLRLKPDHEAANKALGNVLVGSTWMSAKDAEKARLEARAAEFAAKGLVEVDGVGVPKDQVEDAKKGIFHAGGHLVTKQEFAAFTEGKARHPITGEIIDAKDLEQAKSRRFPIGKDGRWVDEQEADRHHSDLDHPWIVRSNSLVLLSSLPISKIEAIKEHLDRAAARLQPILGFAAPRPAMRPAILVASSQEEFRRLGASMGDASSAFAAFVAQVGASVAVPLQGEVRPVVCLWDDGWGPYNLPHAVGLALTTALSADLEVDLPNWFVHALAAFASRFESPATGSWFAQRLAKAGGLQDPATWLGSFAITGTMEFDAIDASMTQAGLLISFCIQGNDGDATKAIQAVTAAFTARDGEAVERSVKSLKSTLGSKKVQLADYLVKLVKEQG